MKLRYIAEAGKRGRKPIYTPRTEEFAKELGIHPVTLKQFFKLGCPQTSVEDIKKWRKENLSIPICTPRLKEFAKEIGISPITLRDNFKLGCHQTSVEDIKKWRKENLLLKPDYISAQNQTSNLESDTPRRFTNTGKMYSDDDSVARQREGDLGKHTTSVVPFGYRLDGNKLVLDNTEQAIIKRMLSRREEGATYDQIARELSADGIPTKTGMGRWNPGSVYMIVRRYTPEYQRRSGPEYQRRLGPEYQTTKRRRLKMVDTPDEATGSARQFSNTGQEYYNDDTAAQARNSPYNKYTISAVPFGFRLNDDRTELLVDPVEQAIIKRIRKLKTEGLKLQEIADILNAEDIKTKTGSKWTQPILQSLIKKTDTPSSKLTGTRVRYGYKSKSVENPEEQAVISRIVKRRTEGAKSQEIADELNADGIKTRNGKPWTSRLVRWISQMAKSRQHTTESKRDFRSLLESVLNY